jgi:glycosyltransferase involved in cell wall biosynthesis
MVPSLNICVVNAFFPPHVSGTARAAFLLANELSRKGHKTVVITSRIRGTPPVEELNDAIVYRLRSVKYPTLEILHKADLYYSLMPEHFNAIVRILKKHRIDIVQTYGQFFDLTLMAVVASKMLRIPVVLTIGTRMEHPRPLYNSLFVLVDKLLVKYLVARRVDGLVVQDRLMRDYMAERYDVYRPLTRFIPTGVDVKQFEKCDSQSVRRKYHIGDDDPVLLSLGTISNLRNPVSLVRAMPNVLKEFADSKLLLVGAIHNPEAMHLAQRLGLRESVIFCGKVDYNMIPSFLGACDVEGHDLDSGLGIGLASLEAMAAGKPVLSSAREDNFIDIRLENWKNIVLVRPGDVEDMSRALIRLFSNKELRDEIGKNAKKLLREYFSLDRVCQEYENLYNEIVKRYGR